MYECIYIYVCICVYVYVGDILLRVRHAHTNGSRISMFRAAFHTGYVPIGVWCVQFYYYFFQTIFFKYIFWTLRFLGVYGVYKLYNIGVFMYLTALYHCVLSMFYRCVEVD